MPVKSNRSGCPVSCSLDVWGDKWSLLIVRDLILFEKHTYGDFMKSSEKIATNILASRLLSLEEHGIISKKEHPESKAKVLYRLTEKGMELLPMVIEMMLWAGKYYPISEERAKMLADIKKNKQAFIQAKYDELKKSMSTEH